MAGHSRHLRPTNNDLQSPRKRFHPFDQAAYQQRNFIERVFCRPKDWRRIATRYDKLAVNFAPAVAVAVIVWWT